MKRTTVFSRISIDGKNEEYFFSASHAQPDLSDEWIPTTFQTLSKEEVKNKFYKEAKEILNPDKNYQI